jgi:sugar lactone lactonase YvrE
MQLTGELLHQIKAQLGEGPVWDPRSEKLYWTDIEKFDLHIYDPATNTDRAINVGQYLGAFAVRAQGGLVLALKSGFATFDLATETITPLADAESHLLDNRFNDGKCDPAGRFWAGSLFLDEDHGQGKAFLYCLNPDHSVQQKLAGVTISNGLAWTADHKTMYYIDSPTECVMAYDYDLATGNIANGRKVISVNGEVQGYPDGMTIDAEGMLWVAHWNGACVRRWNPQTGEVMAEIKLPVSRPTSCVFGGKDFDTLFITSASTRLSAEELATQPLAGSLFVCKPGVKGLPLFEYAG